MVSEAEYDKNQKEFMASQTAMPTAGPSPGTAGPSPTTAGPSPTTAGPQAGSGLYTALGHPEIDNAIANLAGTFGTETPMGNKILLGGAGATGGIAQQAAKQAQVQLSKRTIALLSGSALMGSVIAAFMSIPNTIIGKQVNTWASENNIDLGNLRLNAFEQMYTIPVEDPKTGGWTYLFSDETELRKRMAEAGVPKDLIDNRVIQLSQLKQANAELIGFVGPLENLQSSGQIQPGELPYTAAQRIAKEKITAAQEQQDYLTKPANIEGKTQAEIDIINRRFAAGAQNYPTNEAGQILDTTQDFTSPKNFNTINPKPVGKPPELRSPQTEPVILPPVQTPPSAKPVATPVPLATPANNRPTPQQEFEATRQGYRWNPYRKQWEKV